MKLNEKKKWTRWVFPTPFSSINILQPSPERMQMKRNWNRALADRFILILIKVYGKTHLSCNQPNFESNRLDEAIQLKALRLSEWKTTQMMWMRHTFIVIPKSSKLEPFAAARDTR